MKEVIEKIMEELGNGYEVKKVTVQKTNGIRDGIQIVLTAYPQVGATFYPSERLSVDENVDGIIRALHEKLTPDKIREVLRVKEILGNKDFVRSHLQIKMVNYELNKEWLQDAIYEPVLDLAAVAYLVLNEESDSFESVTLKKGLLSHIGLSEREVLDLAKRNMPEPEVLDLTKAVIHPLGEAIDSGFYVVTNHQKMNGAACMLSPALKSMADVSESDIIVIPSSVHEIIIMKDLGMDKDFLSQMIQEVNADSNCLLPDEVLSDHPYVYRRSSQKLESL